MSEPQVVIGIAGLLVSVTVGVGGLILKDWLDRRQRRRERIAADFRALNTAVMQYHLAAHVAFRYHVKGKDARDPGDFKAAVLERLRKQLELSAAVGQAMIEVSDTTLLALSDMNNFVTRDLAKVFKDPTPVASQTFVSMLYELDDRLWKAHKAIRGELGLRTPDLPAEVYAQVVTRRRIGIEEF